jgi:hypothetical protein
MKRLFGCVFVAALAGLLPAPAAREAAAGEGTKADTVLFLVLPNRLAGNPHLDLKAGKYTKIEPIMALGEALDASAIKLKGVTLATGKYPAAQCKLTAKDGKAIVLQIYFARQVPPKTVLTNIRYKGEAVATYKLGFGGGKDSPVHVFQASVAK